MSKVCQLQQDQAWRRNEMMMSAWAEAGEIAAAAPSPLASAAAVIALF